MGSNLPLVTETFSPGEDHSWLGKAIGTTECDTVTLDADSFLTTFPTGIVPSGVVLGKVTATGLYRQYAANVAEVQTITRTATGGNVDITFDGETAAGVAVVAATTAAQIQAALETLSNINPGDVAVTGADGGPFVVTFGGQYLGEDVPAIVIDDTNATGGTVVVAQTTAGGAAVDDGTEVAAGHLFTTTDLGGTTAGAVDKVVVPLYWMGEVVESKLPVGHGLDAAAKAQLTHIRYV